MLSGSTDSHDELCTKVCLCVCSAVEWNRSLSRERAWQSGSAPEGPAVRGGGGAVGRWRKWSQYFSGQHVWEGREILLWVMRKLRQTRQITPYGINYPTLHICGGLGFFFCMSQFNECPVSILEGHLQYPTYLVFHSNITHVKLRQLVFI